MTETLVQKLAKRPCITIHEKSSIYSLVELLNKYKVGCIVVTSNNINKPVGIISERDLIRNYDEIMNNNNSIVCEVMTKKVISCNIDTSSKELMEIMSKNKIRHVPIMKDNILLGIVSIGDVVKRVIENYAFETKYLREFINN